MLLLSCSHFLTVATLLESSGINNISVSRWVLELLCPEQPSRGTTGDNVTPVQGQRGKERGVCVVFGSWAILGLFVCLFFKFHDPWLGLPHGTAGNSIT